MSMTCNIDSNISTDNIYFLREKYQTLADKLSDTNTTNRKGFYESQQYDNLMIWSFRFYVFYYILAITLILILVFSKNNLTKQVKGGISVVLLSYPYLIQYIINPLTRIYFFIIGFIPKNIYNNL